MAQKKKWLWVTWSVVTLAMTGLATYLLIGPNRRFLLPGPTSHGHYQIELSCNACHTPWLGVKEDACYKCHEAELKAANDSHPKSKFTDPRNADRLQLIKADNCVTCHREHLPAQTRAMGVTLPLDYCAHCHQQTLTDRPSHKNFKFDSCATAGCHNYHDNTALYENFLLKHTNQPAIKDSGAVAKKQLLAFLLADGVMKARPALTAEQYNAPGDTKVEAQVMQDWLTTAHAKAGVNCTDCHNIEDAATSKKRWSDKLDHNSCTRCHKEEVGGFLAGKHGMRLAQNLSPMTPAQARLPMKPEAAHRELSCVSCHGAHEFNTRSAAVDACLSCHNDEHSRAYKNSKHFALWFNETTGETPAGSGVSCATCHLPREKMESEGRVTVRVQHNQNANLRPNEKMIRSVCLDCHGLEFSLDVLADAALIRTNFIGRPARHVESLDLAVQRQMELQKHKPKPRTEK
jgi:hypothetical protein